MRPGRLLLSLAACLSQRLFKELVCRMGLAQIVIYPAEQRAGRHFQITDRLASLEPLEDLLDARQSLFPASGQPIQPGDLDQDAAGVERRVNADSIGLCFLERDPRLRIAAQP